MTADPTIVLLYKAVAIAVITAIAVLTILMLSRLNTEGLGNLSRLRQLIIASPYAISAVGIANEIWASYQYSTPFNFTGILTLLLGPAAVAAIAKRQKEVATTTKGIEEVTDVILNTMPIAARKGAEPQPIPLIPSPPLVVPGSVL